MRQPDRRVGLVDVLAALAARAERVDPQVLVEDLDLDRVVDLRGDVDRREGGVPPRGRVERRDPDEPVDAVLGLHVAVGVLPLEPQGRALDPRVVGVGDLEDLGLPPLQLAVAHVHPHQHLGPVLGLGAAGAGVDLEEGRELVLRLGQLEAELPLPRPLRDRGHRRVGVPLHGLAFAEELGEDLELLALLPERLVVAQDDVGLLELLQRLLGRRRVVPEIGGSGARLQLGLFLFRAADVKGTPVAPRPGWPAPSASRSVPRS